MQVTECETVNDTKQYLGMVRGKVPYVEVMVGYTRMRF